MKSKALVFMRTAAVIPVAAATLFFAKQLPAGNPNFAPLGGTGAYWACKPRPDSLADGNSRTDTSSFAKAVPIYGDGNNRITLEGARALKAELDSKALGMIGALGDDTASKSAFGAAKWMLGEYYNAGYRCLISGHLDMALSFASFAEAHMGVYSGPSAGSKSAWKNISKIYELKGLALLGKAYAFSLLGNDCIDRLDNESAAREFKAAEPFFQGADTAARRAAAYNPRMATPYFIIASANEALRAMMLVFAERESDAGMAAKYSNKAAYFGEIAEKNEKIYSQRKDELRKSRQGVD